MRNHNQLLLSSQVIYLVRSKVLRINMQAGWERGWTAKPRTPMLSLSFTAFSSIGFNKHDISSKQKPLAIFPFSLHSPIVLHKCYRFWSSFSPTHCMLQIPKTKTKTKTTLVIEDCEATECQRAKCKKRAENTG